MSRDPRLSFSPTTGWTLRLRSGPACRDLRLAVSVSFTSHWTRQTGTSSCNGLRPHDNDWKAVRDGEYDKSSGIWKATEREGEDCDVSDDHVPTRIVKMETWAIR